MESSRGCAPVEMKYSAEGLWAQIRRDLATVGLTDRALAELGPVVDIKLLQPGSRVRQSDHLGSLEASKVAFDLISPLSGQVLEVNQRLIERPELVNSSSWSDGWLVKIRLEAPEELDGLLSAQHYAALPDAPSLRRRFQAPPDRGY